MLLVGPSTRAKAKAKAKKLIRNKKERGGASKKGILLGFDVAMDELGVVEVDEGFEDLV